MPSKTTKSFQATRQPANPPIRQLIITIDGPAGVGKSTVAKTLAKRLGLLYLDTGATYRAVAYETLLRGHDPRCEADVVRVARRIRLRLEQSAANGLIVRLNGQDVTRQIRTESVTEAAAIIAQHPRVRATLVRLQRRLARGVRIVVEGRDTGSVVFPRAPFKFFLTARAGVRAQRRQHELRTLHGRSPSVRTIAQQLKMRDELDRRRRVGPLIKPAQAVVVDTSRRSVHDVVERLLQHLPHPSR